MTTVTVSDFSPITLDGIRPKTSTATMDGFTVTDGRGSGEGWSITVQATMFLEWDGSQYVSQGKALPAGSLSMPAPSVAPVGTESPAPAVTPGPYLIDGGSIKMASAAPDTGMGTYEFTHTGPLELSVPSSAYAVTYRSEITLSLSSGP